MRIASTMSSGSASFRRKPLAPAESVVDVRVDVERGEHEHVRLREKRVLRDVARRVDAVAHRHADVHEHHVGTQFLGKVHRLLAVARLAHHR